MSLRRQVLKMLKRRSSQISSHWLSSSSHPF